MTLILDEHFTLDGDSLTCRLRLYETEKGFCAFVSPLVAGTHGLATLTESIATEVVVRLGLPPKRFYLFQHYPCHAGKHEQFFFVEYTWDGNRYQKPTWRQYSVERTEQFLGDQIGTRCPVCNETLERKNGQIILTDPTNNIFTHFLCWAETDSTANHTEPVEVDIDIALPYVIEPCSCPRVLSTMNVRLRWTK